MLRLALLGPPMVSRDGRPVSFDTRKATALLAVLAVEARPQPRDRLAALLWPEADAARARSALRRTLSVTAAAVGDSLDVDRSLVALRSARFSSDVAEFRSLVAAGDPGELRAAARLYRDDFLAGFTLRDAPDFEDWQATVSGALSRELGGVLATLVDLDTREGDLDAAVADAERWLSLDPLHEPAHQALIRLYAWRGQRSAALRQYRACVRVLDTELGVEPLEETTQLYDAVRRNAIEQPTLPPPVPAQQLPAAADARPARPIVGRDVELAALGRALTDRDPQGGFLVAIAGPTGIGKTTLLRRVPEFAPPAAVAVSARCHPEEVNLAFGVAMELARAVIAATPDAVDRLPRHVRSELGRLLPEIAELDSVPSTAHDDPAGPARLYAAVRELFLAMRAPLVAVIDDTHWLDPASADLLTYLIRRLATTPVLFCMSWATDVRDERGVVVRAAVDAVADGYGVELVLRPLTRTDLASLLEATALAVDAERLHTETGGVPSVVSAYVDAVARGDDPGSATPDAVRTALASRVAMLSETAQQVVAAAAVIGGRVDPDVLRETSGRGEAETVSAVEEAMRAGLLVEASSGDGFDFPFDLLRRVVVESMSGARRRLLHARAAEALSRRPGHGRLTAADAGAVARHLREAGREQDAAEWHWRAAQAARTLLAHDEALAHVRDALASGAVPADARLAEGELLIALGRYREAIAALERAAAATDPSGSALGQIERRLADVHHRLGDFTVADAHLATALELFEDAGDDTTVAVALAERALVAYRRGALDDAHSYADAALRTARRTADHATLAQSLDVLGVLAARTGDLAAAEGLLHGSLDHARRGTDQAAVIAALNNLARVLSVCGRHEEALEVAEDALERGVRYGDRHRLAALHTNLADLLRATGRDEDAMEHLKLAASMFAGVDDEPERRPEIWKLVEW